MLPPDIIFLVYKLNDSDIRKIPVSLVIIQAVAYHEFIRDLEACVLHLYVNHPAGGLIQKRAQGHALGISLTQKLYEMA